MRASLSSVLLGAAVASSCAHPHHGEGHGPGHGGHDMPHRFDNADEWARRFEDPERDGWQQPDRVLAALKLPPDAKVADIGAATGYFPVRLARAVPQGRVYGVDIEQGMVDYLTARAKREGLANLEAVLCSADDPKLPEAVDLVLLVNTYHHVSDRPAYFRRLQAKLRQGGRLAIIDFRKGQPMGPPEEHRIGAEQVRQELEAAGYALDADHAFLPNQHFLVFAVRP